MNLSAAPVERPGEISPEGGEADDDEVPDRHHGHCHHHPEGDGGCQEAMETYQAVLLHSAVL